MSWRLEVATTDAGVEVPARQPESRRDAERPVHGHELRARRRIQRVHFADAHREPERRERVPPAAAHLDCEQTILETNPASDVDGPLESIGRDQQRLCLVLRDELGARG